MAIQFQERVTYFGMSGVLTTRLTLVSRDEIVELMKEGAPEDTVLESLGDQLRKGETYITLPNRYSKKQRRVSLETIAREFAGADFDNSFIRIENRFQPDQHRPPSEMLDYFRSVGYSEEQIQELLQREQSAKGSQ